MAGEGVGGGEASALTAAQRARAERNRLRARTLHEARLVRGDAAPTTTAPAMYLHRDCASISAIDTDLFRIKIDSKSFINERLKFDVKSLEVKNLDEITS